MQTEFWDWSELAREALDTALEIGNGQLDLYGLLKATDRIRAQNTGRTGRDQC